MEITEIVHRNPERGQSYLVQRDGFIKSSRTLKLLFRFIRERWGYYTFSWTNFHENSVLIVFNKRDSVRMFFDKDYSHEHIFNTLEFLNKDWREEWK